LDFSRTQKRYAGEGRKDTRCVVRGGKKREVKGREGGARGAVIRMFAKRTCLSAGICLISTGSRHCIENDEVYAKTCINICGCMHIEECATYEHPPDLPERSHLSSDIERSFAGLSFKVEVAENLNMVDATPEAF
jgi:hypothetical protein